MNTGLRKNAKNDFKKYFFKFTNKAVFRKSVDNVRKRRDMKLIAIKARRYYLVSDPSY